MASKERRDWQKNSLIKGTKTEKAIFNIFTSLFENTDYQFRSHPIEFSNVYLDFELPLDVQNNIYNPPEGLGKRMGFIPDFAIDNLKTNKHIYGEAKHQDGWIENGKKKDGRGNAQERSCKFHMPGMIKILNKFGHLDKDILPYWCIFEGNIARDPKHVRELYFWYQGIEDHLLLWDDISDKSKVINHFNNKIKPLLD